MLFAEIYAEQGFYILLDEQCIDGVELTIIHWILHDDIDWWVCLILVHCVCNDRKLVYVLLVQDDEPHESSGDSLL